MTKKKKVAMEKAKKAGPIDNAKAIRVSVSVQDVLNHLEFLARIDELGEDKFYCDKFVLNAIRRYERFWVPFMLTMSESFEDDLNYVPPLGIISFTNQTEASTSGTLLIGAHLFGSLSFQEGE